MRFTSGGQNKPCGLHKVLKINQVVCLGAYWVGSKLTMLFNLGAPRVRAGRAEHEGSRGVGGEREEVKGKRTPSSLVRCKGGELGQASMEAYKTWVRRNSQWLSSMESLANVWTFFPSLLLLFFLLLLLFYFGFSCCVSDMLYFFLRVLGFGAHCFAVLLLCSCFSWSLMTSSNEKVKKNTLFFGFFLGCFLHHLE
jgi:hypothetical protein